MHAPHRLASLALLLSLLPTGCALKNPGTGAPTTPDFLVLESDASPAEVQPIDQPMPYFVLDGEPFCFQGANNYYLSYKSDEAVLDVLEDAAKMQLRVIRTWAFLDRGSLDGSVRNIREPGHQEGIYFQYWDPDTKQPAYNDGPKGLQRMDFVLHHARRLGLKLILVLTNSWRDFGGMDQYLVWYGLEQHHLFYTDSRVKEAYKSWIAHLLSRTNSIDGTLYREDPAIFAWELANEPRTQTHEDFDAPDGWDSATITRWAGEMSQFIKSIDRVHMVSVGDEGFLNRDGKHPAFAAEGGVNHVALTALPDVDFGTFHLYPDHWGTDHRWGMIWIEEHLQVARMLDKPALLEEYGVQVRREKGTSGPVVEGWPRRTLAYQNYNNVMLKRGGAGALFWMLSGVEEGDRLYPDFDHFRVVRGDRTAELLTQYAARFPQEARACELAQGADHGPISPFVQARPAPPARRVASTARATRTWLFAEHP